MKCFKFHKRSSTVSYLIWHTQLVSTVTKTKENKTTKRLRLTKTKLKDILKYEQVEETIKRVSKIKERSQVI